MYESPIKIIQRDVEAQLVGDVLRITREAGVVVDKEELLRALKYDREQYEKGWDDALREKPVYGCWEDEYGGKYANPRYRCSVCKEKALYRFESNELGQWKEVQALTPVCPYCGTTLGVEVSE